MGKTTPLTKCNEKKDFSLIHRGHLPKKMKLEPEYEIMKYPKYPTIKNHVVIVYMTRKLDISRATMKYSLFSKRRPKTFPSMMMKLNEVTGLIFETGRMNIIGGKTFYAALFAGHVFRLLFENIELPQIKPKERKIFLSKISPNKLSFSRIKIENIVASGNLLNKGSFLDLAKYDRYMSDCAVYDPEHFPGLHEKLENMTRLMYDSGYSVIMGVKSKDEIYKKFIQTRKDTRSFILSSRPLNSTERFELRKREILNKPQLKLKHFNNKIIKKP